MSHRGNLVIADEAGYTVRNCHCALALLQLMFWGPQFALNYILDRQETGSWYDIVHDEGSVFIDLHKRIVILYGGEFISDHLPHRQLYLQLMSHVWDGWDIRWGYQGLIDIFNQLKSHPFDLTREGYSDYYAPSLSELEDDGLIDEWPEAVISIKFADDDLRVQYANDPYLLLQHGDTVIEKMREVSTLRELKWEHNEPQFPREGVHIDVPEKCIYFWSSNTIYRPTEFGRKWKEWEFVWLKDNYQKHIEFTHNRLKLEIPSDEEALQHLKAYLLIEITLDDIRGKEDFYDVESHGIKVPDYSTFYVDKLPPIEERTKIFDDAVKAWRASQS